MQLQSDQIVTVAWWRTRLILIGTIGKHTNGIFITSIISSRRWRNINSWLFITTPGGGPYLLVLDPDFLTWFPGVCPIADGALLIAPISVDGAYGLDLEDFVFLGGATGAGRGGGAAAIT